MQRNNAHACLAIQSEKLENTYNISKDQMLNSLLPEWEKDLPESTIPRSELATSVSRLSISRRDLQDVMILNNNKANPYP